MSISLPALPYAETALEPVLSARTIGFHYGKHHKAYVDKLNDLVKGTDLESKSLEDIILATAGKADKAALFNNAAQAANHTFFWQCLKAGGGGTPDGKLADGIRKAFGSFEEFQKQFVDAGMTQFGSGWAWLVLDQGTLKIAKTANADTPIAHGQKPLFTVDVWEHAYYLDFQNRRKDFLEAVLHRLANWDAAAARLP